MPPKPNDTLWQSIFSSPLGNAAPYSRHIESWVLIGFGSMFYKII